MTPSIAANDLVVETTGGIPNGFAQSYYGSTQAQTPSGTAFAAWGSTTRLTPFVQADPSGFYSLPVDNTQGPMQSHWTAGSNWNFQLWYRDSQAPGSVHFNFSDAMSLTFQP